MYKTLQIPYKFINNSNIPYKQSTLYTDLIKMTDIFALRNKIMLE